MSAAQHWRWLGVLPQLSAVALGLVALLRAIESAYAPLVAIELFLVISGVLVGLLGPLLGFSGGELPAQALLAIGYFATALALPRAAGMLELFGAVLIFLICGEAAAIFAPLVARQRKVERALRKGARLDPPPLLGDLVGVARRWFVVAGTAGGASLALTGVSVYAGGLLVLPAESVLGLGILLVVLIGLVIGLLVTGAELSGDENAALVGRRSP